MAGSGPAAPAVFIWVRTAVEWGNEGAFRAQLKPEFLPKLERWNATFSIPYNVFRHEVCETARLNLSRVAGADVRPWHEIPDGAVVLPVDDDDWFAPDIVERLVPHLRTDLMGCRWMPSYLEVPVGIRHRTDLLRRRVLPWARPRYLCATNSYAFVKRPDTEAIGRSHVQASRVFEEERGRVRVVDGWLSIVNRTLASQTVLLHDRPAIPVRRLLRKYAAYRRLYRAADLAGIEWAREYVDRMARLMDGLMLRPAGRA